MIPQKRNSVIKSMSAPIGGWNVKDPLPEMSPLDAVVLDNVFCLPSELMVRKGYTSWATGMSDTVETLINYDSPFGVQILFAAAGSDIYDVSAIGAVGTAVVTGQSSALYKYSNFTNSGGSFLHAVNGNDYLLLYDGTTWRSITGVSTPYAITGVDTSYLVDVALHKRRLWFVERASSSLWYLAVDAIAGTATELNLGAIFRFGGHIVKIDTWTLDAGYGVDDYLVIFTSNGEVAVYSGTDPASADTWSLIGIFYIGSPVGSPTGHTCKYGGDLLILNKDGIAQMSKSLMSSRVNTKLTLTEKIQPQLASDTTEFGSQTPWDLLLFPPANMLIVNVPTSSSTSMQYVMNTISGAWSRWLNLNATCFSFANEELFFGDANGNVYRAWDGFSDNGDLIQATILPAFNKFGNEGQLKRWNMGRIILSLSGQAAYGTKLLTDFDKNTQIITLPSSTTTSGAIWDTAKWDEAIWSGGFSIERKWRNISGLGYWGSLQINVETQYTDVRLYSIDYCMEAGSTF